VPPLLAGTGKDETHLIVAVTADRGLCGGFNGNIAKLAKYQAQKLIAEGKTVKIITVGKKGREVLKRDLADHFVDHVDLSEVKRLGYADAAKIAQDVLNRFDAGEFDVAKMYYSKFESVISQKPTEHQLIPASFEAPEEGEATGGVVYDYEPSEEAILADLLPRGVATQIFSALLENGAGEQGARMSAMDNATRNAGDMIDRLTIEFNRSRQAVITNELIEIISGAEAL
jgi:F-type H+-transporting ATPase subunit gamma